MNGKMGIYATSAGNIIQEIEFAKPHIGGGEAIWEDSSG